MPHRDAEVIIAGDGCTAMLLALSLLKEGLRVDLVKTAGTARLCTGFGTLLPGDAMQTAVDQSGHAAARIHLQTLQQITQALPARLASIAPLELRDAYAYALLERDLPALSALEALCRSLGLSPRIAEDAGDCPFPVEQSLLLPGQLCHDPDRLLPALRSAVQQCGGRFRQHRKPLRLHRGRVCSADGEPFRQPVVFTDGLPPGTRASSLLAALETRTVIRSHVVSDVPLHTLQRSVHPGGLAITPVPGGAMLTWEIGRTGTTDDRAVRFDRLLQRRMPDWSEASRTCEYAVYSADGLPRIGAMPGTDGRALFAAGLGDSGLTGEALAAGVLARHLLGRPAPSDAVYAPDRPVAPRLLRRQLTRYAASALHRNSPACPHMGCRMRFSTASLRWECPFCGSAFDQPGRRIFGPAASDADDPRLRNAHW